MNRAGFAGCPVGALRTKQSILTGIGARLLVTFAALVVLSAPALAATVTVTWTVSGGGLVDAFTISEARDVTSPAVITDTSVHFGLLPDIGYVLGSASDNCGGSLNGTGNFWQLPGPLNTDCHVDFTFIPADPPTVDDTTTSIDANSTGNPVNLDISGLEITSVAVASAPSNGTATVSGTTITYTPDAGYAGPDSFTYTATNAAGTSATATATIEVQSLVFIISPSNLPDGEAGTAYSQVITASGGTAPYTFAVTDGSLSAGLSLATDGTLSGTPTEEGSFDFTVTATDSGPGSFQGLHTYNLTIAEPVIILDPTADALPAATGGSAYSQSISASGGTAPYSFAMTAGSLPDGLSLAADGTLAGTATETDSFTFTVTTTDAYGFTGTRDYTLVVNVSSTNGPGVTPQAVPIFGLPGLGLLSFLLALMGFGALRRW